MLTTSDVAPPPKRRRFRLPSALAWVALTPFAGWAVARVAGLERGDPFVPIMSLTPYAAAGSLIPLTLAGLSRKRAVTAAALAVTVTFGICVIPRMLASPVGPGRPLRILTTNLYVGRGSPQAVIDLVKRLNVDVLSVQELTNPAVDELEAAGIGKLLPYTLLEPDFSPAGSGLYSKYPVARLTGLFNPVGHHMPTATISLPGLAVQFVVVHPVAPVPGSLDEWQEGLQALPTAPSSGPPLVLAGDFNATLDHKALRDVLARGFADAGDATGSGLKATWPNGKRRIPPMITLDHVLYDSRQSAASVDVYDIPGSDHRALFAELRLHT